MNNKLVHIGFDYVLQEWTVVRLSRGWNDFLKSFDTLADAKEWCDSNGFIWK